MTRTSLLNKIKPYAVTSLYHSGYFDVLRTLKKGRMTILMYHRFSPEPEPFKVSQRIFENQLRFFQGKYNFISFNDYLQILNGENNQLPSNPLLVTIDDGFQDNFTYAYPLLKKYKVPATIFLTTDFISRRAWLWSNRLEYLLKKTTRKKFDFSLSGSNESFKVESFEGWHKAQLKIFNHCRNLENHEKNLFLDQLAHYLSVQVPAEVTDAFLPLTWEQIREMHENGVEFGSHSCSHSISSRLSQDALRTELINSKREIEKNIAAPVDFFCYPNGQPEDYSEAVIEQVRKAGYKAAVTTVSGYNINRKTDPFRLKRIALGVDHHPTLSRALTR